MSLFKRLFSSAYRQGVTAEAKGDLEAAAKAYALAGERDKVCQMNLARAEAAKTRGDEIDALRAAVRWADQGSELGKRSRRKLAEALCAQAKLGTARGPGSVLSDHDRSLLLEGAELFQTAGAHQDAAACFELCGDDAAASRAYGAAGQLEKMELALARDEQRDRRARRLREAFDEYQLHLAGGDRESARSALQLCLDVAEQKGEYRRLYEELEAKRIASGLLRVWPGGSGAGIEGISKIPLTVCGLTPIRMGREPGAELPLRGGGLSRWHAEAVWTDGGWRLRDAGSRNGTRIAGVRLAGEVPLLATGEFELGDDSRVRWSEADGVLTLEVTRGLDRGRVLLAGLERPIPLPDLPMRVSFKGGRPYLEVTSSLPRLNGARTQATVQLVHGDLLEVGDARLEVA